MKGSKIFIVFSIVFLLITGCSNGIKNEGDRIIVEKLVNETHKYEYFNKISDSEDIKTVRNILSSIRWKNGKLDMPSPATHRIYFEDTKEENKSNKLIYELWFNLGNEVVVAINSESKYAQLNEENSEEVSRLLIKRLGTSFFEELDKLPQKYDSELAILNGDVVNSHKGVINVEKLENFIDSCKIGKLEDYNMIRITSYTIEGDAIIHDLISNSDGIKLVEDTTRDNYSGEENRKKTQYKVIEILKENRLEGLFYIAKLDNGEERILSCVNNGQ